MAKRFLLVLAIVIILTTVLFTTVPVRNSTCRFELCVENFEGCTLIIEKFGEHGWGYSGFIPVFLYAFAEGRVKSSNGTYIDGVNICAEFSVNTIVGQRLCTVEGVTEHIKFIGGDGSFHVEVYVWGGYHVNWVRIHASKDGYKSATVCWELTSPL